MSVELANHSITTIVKAMENFTNVAFKREAATVIHAPRAALPKWWLPVYFTLLVVSLALPRKARISYTVPIVGCMVAMLPFHTEGSFKKDFDLGNLALGWFFFYLGLCFGSPEREFWKKDGRNLKPEEREAEVRSKTTLERLQWSLQIWTNPRGVGWSHEAPGMKRQVSEKW